MSLWIAEADGELITAGRLEPVAGTAFAIRLISSR
jgi:hypothetical protein